MTVITSPIVPASVRDDLLEEFLEGGHRGPSTENPNIIHIEPLLC